MITDDSTVEHFSFGLQVAYNSASQHNSSALQGTLKPLGTIIRCWYEGFQGGPYSVDRCITSILEKGYFALNKKENSFANKFILDTIRMHFIDMWFGGLEMKMIFSISSSLLIF